MPSESFELIGGREYRPIVMAPADPRWPEIFECHKARIAKALGLAAVRIDHIGSTSVPGLVAKPIIDLDLSVADPDNEADYLPALVEAGYQLRVREPGHLLFRNWLRQDSTDRAAYARLKCLLAEREWLDMNAYAAAKGPLIAQITERAEEWASVVGWSV
jgi:GrpB-like predicted nucleotidyltransferase (UPF0157 family)